MTSSSNVRIHVEKAGQLAAGVMRAGGCTDAEASITADHLIGANLAGHDSHGLVRIPRYHSWMQDGTLNGNTELRTVLDAGALMQFDGDRGIGQFLAQEACARGIERAKSLGIAMVALRRAGHIGRLGHYTEQAVDAGFVSIQFCNVTGSALVAPFGSAQRLMSTNPVSVGIPNDAGDPFILDFATSFVAEGKVLVAASGGKALPHGALIDGDGQLTADPSALYGETTTSAVPDATAGPGALRTIGEHKGSGLALACDLLAGILTGNRSNAASDTFGNGWLAIFIDPAKLDDGAVFGGDVAHYIDTVRGLKTAAGVDKVRIPGDVERQNRADRLANGLPITEALLTSLLATANECGMRLTRDDLVIGTARES